MFTRLTLNMSAIFLYSYIYMLMLSPLDSGVRISVLVLMLIFVLSYVVKTVLHISEQNGFLGMQNFGDVDYIMRYNNLVLINGIVLVLLGFFLLNIEAIGVAIVLAISTIIWLRRLNFTAFNPILLLMGYNFYFIVMRGVIVTLISKKTHKNPMEIHPQKKYMRLDDHTYIDTEE